MPSDARTTLNVGRAGRGWIATLVLPATALLTTCIYYPLVRTVYFSGTDYNGISPAQWRGAQNYVELFHDDVFLKTAVNTVVITVATSLLLVIVPFVFAYWLHLAVPGRGFFRVALYVPVVVPVVVSAVTWRWMLAENGMLNYALSLIGIGPVDWLGDPLWSVVSVVWVIFWRAFGIYLLLYLAGFASFPHELLEAAHVDGAGHVRTFISIVVPTMRHTIVLATVIAISASMKLFDEIFLLTGGGPVNATKNTSYLIWETAFKNFKFGQASAMGTVLLVAIIAAVLTLTLFARRDDA